MEAGFSGLVITVKALQCTSHMNNQFDPVWNEFNFRQTKSYETGETDLLFKSLNRGKQHRYAKPNYKLLSDLNWRQHQLCSIYLCSDKSLRTSYKNSQCCYSLLSTQWIIRGRREEWRGAGLNRAQSPIVWSSFCKLGFHLIKCHVGVS